MRKTDLAKLVTAALTMAVCAAAAHATVAMLTLVMFRGGRGSAEGLGIVSLWYAAPYYLMGWLAFRWRTRITMITLLGVLLLSCAGVLLVHEAYRHHMTPPIPGRHGVMNCGPPVEFLIPVMQYIGFAFVQTVACIFGRTDKGVSASAHVSFERYADEARGLAHNAQRDCVHFRE